MNADAIVIFNAELAEPLSYRLRRAGQTWSKMRFASAQLLAYVQDGLYLRLARHANAIAARIGRELSALSGIELVAPVDANMLFLRMPDRAVRPSRPRAPLRPPPRRRDPACHPLRYGRGGSGDAGRHRSPRAGLRRAPIDAGRRAIAIGRCKEIRTQEVGPVAILYRVVLPARVDARTPTRISQETGALRLYVDKAAICIKLQRGRAMAPYFKDGFGTVARRF